MSSIKKPPQVNKPAASTATPPSGGVAASAGLEIGLQLVVGVLFCGGIGFALDTWLGSLPWLMLLGGVLGFAGWMFKVAKRPRPGS